jgi:hypothetical protein
MARSEFEADSASSQFFWLLFESDLTPAGKNLLDGRCVLTVAVAPLPLSIDIVYM